MSHTDRLEGAVSSRGPFRMNHFGPKSGYRLSSSVRLAEYAVSIL